MIAEQHACEQQDRRFVVRLPLKMDSKQLGFSRLSTERSLHSIERRLERDPELKIQYHSFIKVYEYLGHMDTVKALEGSQPCSFPPHNSFFKTTSTTIQTRAVSM